MNKNLEELKEQNQDRFFEGLGLQIFIGYYLIPILEDFEKRLIKLEKNKEDLSPRIRLIKEETIEHQEINETDGINNIKIILNNPKLKRKGEKDGKH